MVTDVVPSIIRKQILLYSYLSQPSQYANDMLSITKEHLLKIFFKFYENEVMHCMLGNICDRVIYEKWFVQASLFQITSDSASLIVSRNSLDRYTLSLRIT